MEILSCAATPQIRNKRPLKILKKSPIFIITVNHFMCLGRVLFAFLHNYVFPYWKPYASLRVWIVRVMYALSLLPAVIKVFNCNGTYCHHLYNKQLRKKINTPSWESVYPGSLAYCCEDSVTYSTFTKASGVKYRFPPLFSFPLLYGLFLSDYHGFGITRKLIQLCVHVNM